MIRFAKQTINHRLSLLPGDLLRQRWLDHVRAYPRGQSKPDPGPFDHSGLSRHPLRQLGSHWESLRRQSGLFLPAPSTRSAEPFKIWEKSGETHSPALPHSLLGQKPHDTFYDYHPSFSSRPSFVLRIPGGSFHGHDHTLFDREFHPVDWEPPYWALDCGLPGTLFRKRLPRPLQLHGRALVLSAPAGGGNIWHFLFDSLPKLKLLQDAGLAHEAFDHILIDSLKMPYVAEALEILGIDRGKVIETEKHPLVTADELTYVTLGCLLPPDPWVLHWLREKFLPKELPVGPQKKILISRAGALRRRLHGEEDLTRRLLSAGFEAVALETLTFRQQIALMATAEVVVATHGAGLTNLVWCPSTTRVVELFSAEYISVCYWNISRMLNLNYIFGIGEPTMQNIVPVRAVLDMKRLEADLVFPDAEALFKSIMAFAFPQTY